MSTKEFYYSKVRDNNPGIRNKEQIETMLLEKLKNDYSLRGKFEKIKILDFSASHENDVLAHISDQTEFVDNLCVAVCLDVFNKTPIKQPTFQQKNMESWHAFGDAGQIIIANITFGGHYELKCAIEKTDNTVHVADQLLPTVAARFKSNIIKFQEHNALFKKLEDQMTTLCRQISNISSQLPNDWLKQIKQIRKEMKKSIMYLIKLYERIVKFDTKTAARLYTYEKEFSHKVWYAGCWH